MHHLLLTLCLAAEPATCAERLLPGAFADEAACAEGAAARAEAWLAAHPGLRLDRLRCAPAEGLPALDLTPVAPGLFLHLGTPALPDRANRGAIANLGVVIGRDAIAVIDAGSSRAEAEALLAAIRARSGLPIRAVILTHMHPDHSLGAELFREAGAEILGAPKLAAALAARADAWMESYPPQVGAASLIGSRFVAPDRGVAAATLDLGGATLRLQAVPTAHTDNDLTVFHVESGTLFTGDLVFNGLLPTLDGSLVGWLDWLAADRPEVRRIVPGHGPAPLPWPDGAAATRDYLQRLAAQVRAAIAAGDPMSAAIARADPADAARWNGHAVSHPRNVSAAYAELEWE